MKDPVRRKIDRYGLTAEIDPSHFFPTVGSAVDAYRAQFGAQWTAPAPAEAAPPARTDSAPPPRLSSEKSAPTSLG